RRCDPPASVLVTHPCDSVLRLTFYLFQRHLTHRDRHSFPTRRSSDLGKAETQHAIDLNDRLAKARILTVGGAGDVPAANDPAFEDRKSTRLNSSHQIISYAVFCLKKKT